MARSIIFSGTVPNLIIKHTALAAEAILDAMHEFLHDGFVLPLKPCGVQRRAPLLIMAAILL